jgi:AAA15 family ATPase/GTPase
MSKYELYLYLYVKMLLEFSVTNFRSIKEKQTISLLKTKKNELENNFTTITLSTGKTIDTLNGAVIYGANASGKSNLVLALEVMVNIVQNSAKYQPGEQIQEIEPYIFSDNSVNTPTEFEIDFIENGVRFVYGFSATREKIIDEWLYQYPKGRPQVLIERENTNSWGKMTALKGNKKVLIDSTKDNSLFLSTGTQLNNKQIRFNNFTSQLEDTIDNFAGTCYAIKENKQQILKIFNNMGFNLHDIWIDAPLKEYIVPACYESYKDENGEKKIKLVSEASTEKIEDFSVITKKDIYFIYKDSSKNTLISLSQESQGTQKIFNIIGHWLFALENGYTLVSDELQNSLHPKLVEYFVQMFNNPELNTKGAQIIFTTHESSLLDQEIFRRDQIWFCEKENNATRVFSLTDFKVRKGVDDLEKAYLSGRYGAVPFLR